jgi:hypothetical protein
MSIVRRCALSSCALILLSGCTSYRGADRMFRQVTYTGTVTEVGQRGAPGALGLSKIFAMDLRDAYTARSANISADERQAYNDRMLKSGLALVRANCREYFHEMGRNHRNSRVLRDLVTPITNVLTGLIALHVFSDGEATNTNILKGLAIGSGAASAGLDIYDNRFLFGSDNMGAVETMIVTALGNHQSSLETSPPNDFVFVVTHLLDNENICTPTQILTLVRESIRAANPKPKDGAGGDEGEDDSNDDEAATEDNNPDANPNVARPVSVDPKS